MSDLTLDHIVIAVNDLEAATQDYIALLGRGPSWRGEHPKYGTKNTLFRIDNMYIELLALADGGRKDKRWYGELQRFLDQRGEGLYALALGTPDIKAATRDAHESGLEVIDPADGDGIDLLTGARREWRNAMMSVKSTNGARLFFIEHKSKPEALPVAEVRAEPGAFVKRMDHAVILSADMEASRRVWADALGVRLALDRTFPDRNTRILFFRAGDITVEISGGAEQSEEGVGKPDRMWGLAWGVDSVEGTCARLQAAGIETSGPRNGIKPGTRIATVKGGQTHGVATLLIEHTEASFQPEAREPRRGAFDNAPQRRAFTAKSLDHVVISASDLDATAARWRDNLHMTVSDEITLESAGFRLAKLPAGNTFIELVQPLSPDHRIARSIADRGQGMFSMSIEVDDLVAAIADLRAKGVLVSDPEDGAFPGTRVARVNKQAANGVSMQLLQRS